ncbi:hypothetical protein [Albidovulum sediminis]|uniref:Uncharacterized protein n=1 Tax=Albidovulum sediminis TaxID=3066345 RepID=A0ABT2NQ23_9RHOB|nr:hypothetical protein [Defluviimonas sediminis]MCT8330795.1 hypothetical protein [Defluviimonas sediminis]
MFGCIDPAMAVFMAETPSCTAKGRDVVEWVAFAAASFLAATSLLVTG